MASILSLAFLGWTSTQTSGSYLWFGGGEIGLIITIFMEVYFETPHR